MKNKFRTLEDLYKYLLPALYSKRKEFERRGLIYLREEDIWNYLTESKWQSDKDLSIAKMVSDIFNVDKYKIEAYLFNIIKNSKRSILKNEEGLL